jgi:flavin-dependent dehydrogenase
LVRRQLLGKTTPESLVVAAGYLIPRTLCHNIILKFPAGLQGYAWAFPRAEGTSLGICAPAAQNRAADLRLLLDEFLHERFPEYRPEPTEAYRATLFIRTMGRRGPFSGRRWALVGDAAGFPDPITLEGIQYALESARLLATALTEGEPERYAGMCKDTFLSEHVVGAQLARYVYRHELLEKAITAAEHNPDARAVLADICSATVSYRTLRRRLISVLGRRLISRIFR